MLTEAIVAAADLSRRLATTPGLEWIYEKAAGGFAFLVVSLAVATAPAAPLILPWLLAHAAGSYAGLTPTAATMLGACVGLACAGRLTFWQLSWFEHEQATEKNIQALAIVAVAGVLWVGLIAEGTWRVLFDKGFWMTGGPRWLAPLPAFLSVPLGWAATSYPTLTWLISMLLDLCLALVAAWTAAQGWAFWTAGAAMIVMYDGAGSRVVEERRKTEED